LPKVQRARAHATWKAAWKLGEKEGVKKLEQYAE